MEFYALRDIEPGEEVFLDYGDSWDREWNRHVQDWESPLYQFSYDSTLQDLDSISSHSKARCWVDEDALDSLSIDSDNEDDEEGEEDRAVIWKNPLTRYIDDSYACYILEVESDSEEDIDTAQSNLHKDTQYYRIEILNESHSGVHVRHVPRNASAMVENPYTSNQFLRQSFLHMIPLHEAMIPAQWRDLDIPTYDDPDECGL
jgi:hypothetical protein